MSWVLRSTDTGERFVLPPGEAAIGRRDCYVLIVEATVSRVHALVHVAQPVVVVVGSKPAPVKITIVDKSSFQHTFVNDELVSKDTPREVGHGDALTIGREVERHFVFEWEPTVFCAASEVLEAWGSELEKACQAIGCYLTTEWTGFTTHLLSDAAKSSGKLLACAVGGGQVVTPGFVRTCRDRKSTDPWPQPQNFRPAPRDPAQAEVLAGVLHSPQRRTSLFRALAFLFLDPSKCAQLKPVIEGGSGAVILTSKQEILPEVTKLRQQNPKLKALLVGEAADAPQGVALSVVALRELTMAVLSGDLEYLPVGPTAAGSLSSTMQTDTRQSPQTQPRTSTGGNGADAAPARRVSDAGAAGPPAPAADDGRAPPANGGGPAGGRPAGQEDPASLMPPPPSVPHCPGSVDVGRAVPMSVPASADMPEASVGATAEAVVCAMQSLAATPPAPIQVGDWARRSITRKEPEKAPPREESPAAPPAVNIEPTGWIPRSKPIASDSCVAVVRQNLVAAPVIQEGDDEMPRKRFRKRRTVARAPQPVPMSTWDPSQMVGQSEFG